MTKKKILAVDDDRHFLNMLDDVLSGEGFEVVKAGSLSGIYDTVKKNRPDLILLDIVLPGVDGFKIKKMLNEDPGTAGIPVIFVTVKQEIPEKIRGFKLGADDYIVKPYDPDELVARINAILNKREYYEKISMTDGLTGLYNYKFFKKQFGLMFNGAKRYKDIFSLVIIDIDDLKRVNDGLGHKAGDIVLSRFSVMLKETARSADVVARYGGDEFTVLMPKVNERQAGRFVSRLRRKIASTIITVPSCGAKVGISIGAGVVTFSGSFKNQTKMFEVADKRLYEDKRRKS